ncbi:MAG TPA: SH3 domain-containing protein [Firmicutes bacterium]|nr:SH3 domain-containing protein [Candidatus Fermentithermobacillaceae bacterium]
MSIAPRATRRKRRPGLVWPLLFIALISIGVALAVPSFLYVEKPPASRPYLIFRGEKQEFPVVMERGEAYVPYSFIKTEIDPEVFWDEETGTVVVTTKDKVVKLKTASLTAHVNQNPVDLMFPVVLDGGEPYIPASVLEILYPLSASYYPGEGVFIVRPRDEVSLVGISVKDVIVRESPSILSKRIGIAPAGTELSIHTVKGGWLRVDTDKGLVGWVPARDVDKAEWRKPSYTPPKDYTPKPLGARKVALVWEQVDKYNPDTSKIGDMPGLNVVSPTWFRLGEKPGEVENYADFRYVAWAHERGYQVWALFSNSFELERTRAVLRNSDLRDKVISQILMYARLYSLDGINIDFENVYQDDAPYLTQFVRELTPLLHEAGLTVSIDITVKSMSPTWSLCYERDRLAEVVDYVMLMAYDEYWAGSPVAGPTASLPWTEWCVKKTLEEVPAEKLVLGVPFYTRLWTEVKDGSGVKVSQTAYGMTSAEGWLKTQGVEARVDPRSGLRYAEKTVGDRTYKIWLEDAGSMAERMEIAEKYGLAGIAAWRRGLETPDIWDVIADYVKK